MSDSLIPAAPPELTAEQASAMAREFFGVHASAKLLGSNQDRNALLTPHDGSAQLLLKIANPATDPLLLEAQSNAADQIAEYAKLPVPLARRQSTGEACVEVTLGGERAFARLLSFVPGTTLSGSGYLAPRVVRALGALAARVDLALADLPHTALETSGQWDMRRAADVSRALLPAVSDSALRARLENVLESAWAEIAEFADLLPTQVIHGDLTDDNVVTSVPVTRFPDGLIDLGDLAVSWTVAELAITLSSLLHHDGVTLPAALRAASAYHQVRPLTDAEVAVLWPLVVARAVVLVVSAHQVIADDPGNVYAEENLAHELLILDAATSVPLAVGTALVRAAVRQPGVELTASATAPLCEVSPVVMLDFSPTSEALDAGRWLEPGIETELASAALDAGAALAVAPFGVPRLTRSPLHNQAEPANVPLGIELYTSDDLVLNAPWSGEVSTSDGETVLTTPELRLRVLGAEPTTIGAVAAGSPFALTRGTARVQVESHLVHAPWFVPASLVSAWRSVVADPTTLIIGAVAPTAAADAAALGIRRSAHVADVQEHYFDEPPVMVRGWREHLIDADGRVYLDTLNNVSSVGHGHPRLADAVARQWRLLNTNSRFHYPAITEFAERLAGMLPPGLDHVFLVNSGSEAVDLALRLARAHTGRRDILAVREAYHGWTDLSDAVSTSVADNPNALTTRPDWVHTVDAPNSYRGRHRDAEAARYAPEAVAEVDRLAAEGTPVGAFIAEPVYGNAGGVALPTGYLDAVYSAVRAHGGLAVADEVQVGYGRLGSWMWGFEQQGVVPDIVAVAKAMGGGHPLGAVICSREIAESYRTQGYFFSSAGGSPVSCVVGLTVLDIFDDEKLVQNAAEVGAYLKERLAELGAQHPLLDIVHGEGLYLGPEFVLDPTTREPATAQTAAICARLRELGVIAQPTGDHQNVLKLKPPMCFTKESADSFVAALERVLGTGW